MKRLRCKVLSYGLLLAILSAAGAAAQSAAPSPASSKKETAVGLQMKVGDAPTYIKSASVILKTNERVFTYTGGVEVKHGDLTMTADILEGRYDESNQIETLTAKSNVVILNQTMRGTCQKAIYDKRTETVTLTENPELQQQGSVLTADAIKMFIKEDRSTAEGNVRVKLVKQDEKDGKEKKGKSDKPALPMP